MSIHLSQWWGHHCSVIRGVVVIICDSFPGLRGWQKLVLLRSRFICFLCSLNWLLLSLNSDRQGCAQLAQHGTVGNAKSGSAFVIHRTEDALCRVLGIILLVPKEVYTGMPISMCGRLACLAAITWQARFPKGLHIQGTFLKTSKWESKYHRTVKCAIAWEKSCRAAVVWENVRRRRSLGRIPNCSGQVSHWVNPYERCRLTPPGAEPPSQIEMQKVRHPVVSAPNFCYAW